MRARTAAPAALVALSLLAGCGGSGGNDHSSATAPVKQPRPQVIVETCATYWHTIDFLWVLIFALLYVMR